MRISDWSSDVCSSDLLAARTGVAVSAIRFYEARGLIEALRTGGGQRRFLRADIRRVSFILIAQQMGLRLEEIGDELARLPAGRTPNGADWTRISTGLRARIDARIAALTRTRGLPDPFIAWRFISPDRTRAVNGKSGTLSGVLGGSRLSQKK